MPVKAKTVRLGILADTHIPDRIKNLPQNLVNALQSAELDTILHAGDVSVRRVIHDLEKIAPVTAVQGNRDWLFGLRLPRVATMTIHGVQIVLAHGHLSMIHYLVDKIYYLFKGYAFERYRKNLIRLFPDGDVFIFGHTHYQIVQWVNDQIFINPGAAYPCKFNQSMPHFAVLSITPEGNIRTELHKIKSGSK